MTETRKRKMAIRLDGTRATLKDMTSGIDDMIDGTPRIEGSTGTNADPNQ